MSCRVLDEVARYEPPHQDLHCLQIQLFSSLVVKELNMSLQSSDLQRSTFKVTW